MSVDLYPILSSLGGYSYTYRYSLHYLPARAVSKHVFLTFFIIKFYLFEIHLYTIIKKSLLIRSFISRYNNFYFAVDLTCTQNCTHDLTFVKINNFLSNLNHKITFFDFNEIIPNEDIFENLKLHTIFCNNDVIDFDLN